MEVLNQFFAVIFEKFKAKNPTVAATLALILILINMNIDTILAAWNIQGTVANTIKVVFLAISAVFGSRTFNYLPENQPMIENQNQSKNQAESN